MGLCFELRERGACLFLLMTEELFSTQQSLADDHVKISCMDCCVLQLLHHCLHIDINLVQEEELHFSVANLSGVWRMDRYLTSLFVFMLIL